MENFKFEIPFGHKQNPNPWLLYFRTAKAELFKKKNKIDGFRLLSQVFENTTSSAAII